MRSFDGMCRMIQANLGIGVLPAGAIAQYVKSMGIRTIPLDEDWASRKINLCARDFEELPATARRLVQHLSLHTDS